MNRRQENADAHNPLIHYVDKSGRMKEQKGEVLVQCTPCKEIESASRGQLSFFGKLWNLSANRAK